MKARAAEILMVEDNVADIDMTKEAFEEAKILNRINICTDGAQAIDYLSKIGRFHDAVTPDIILLDLNLPKKSGFEVLDFIKSDNELKKIPVVVLTTSDTDKDILKSYQKYANCYITKPVNYDKFMSVVSSMGNFWLSIVKLPE